MHCRPFSAPSGPVSPATAGLLRAVLLTAVLVPTMVAAPSIAFCAGTGEPPPRIVVLGFDGADPHLTEQYMDEGYLPNLARLRESGTYARLGTTTPPQTPVSWSSFATGMNPGRHTIFDFLRRDLTTYQPDFAMYLIGSRKVLWGKNNHYLVALVLFAVSILLGLAGGRLARRVVRGLWMGLLVGLVLGGSAVIWARDMLPYRRPTVENTRRGETFWEIAGDHGVRSKVVRVPATFPAEPYDLGHLLSGLGVPDIRGTMGTFTLYTTESLSDRVDENTEMGGKIIQVSLLNGEAESYVFGPRNRLFDDPPDILPPLRFRVNRTADPHTVTVNLQGQTETIPLGEWSEWFTIEFQMSPVISLYGIARFNFVSSEPFALYLSAINLDPHSSPLPISHPEKWSRDLAHRFGLYKTLGWSMDTWALNELRIDEETFLEDVYFSEGKFGEMMRGLMEDKDHRLYVHVYELTDRVAHVFWRLLDPEHPAYDPDLAAVYGNAIRDSYVFMDQRVGEAMERMRPEDVLFILSDHGFHTWHKAVNYNTWLVRNGYMTLKSNRPDTEKKLEDLFGQGQFWPNVDWQRTKAYAMGLGDIYLNVKGREAQGIVEPGREYERIRDQLVSDLEGWIDPETGDRPVRRARKREEVYAGYDDDLIPDLLLGNNPKYRVSWQTSLGGIPPNLMQINDRKWSGDHCSFDAEITKGIFFSNRKLDAEGASILDLFPTILGYLGIEVPENRDGRVLKEQ